MKLGPVFQYLLKALSDNGSPSASRLLTVLHSFVACGCLIYLVGKNHIFPDGMTLTGLGAFVTAPYAINRATNAFGKDQGPKPDLILAAQVPPVAPTNI